jgi:hypothetical protein
MVSTQPELPVRCCTIQAPAIMTESDAAMATNASRYKAVMKKSRLDIEPFQNTVMAKAAFREPPSST